MQVFKLYKIFIVVALCVGCSSEQKRTRFSDKNMRIMIDPDSISIESYVRIQKALVERGAFAVIDRASGMAAVKKEQERLHRNETDRFSDREKWSHWGRLFGVGAIVVAHDQCYNKASFWNPQYVVRACDQFLTLVDANTGEVIAAVEGKGEAPAVTTGGVPMVPSWDEITNKLVDAYPKNFKFEPYTKSVVEYQDLSEEAAKRQRELATEKENKK